MIKELKVINSFNFELRYSGNMFMVIGGCVSPVIDLVSQRKSSNIEYMIPQKRTFPKEILKLYKHDI